MLALWNMGNRGGLQYISKYAKGENHHSQSIACQTGVPIEELGKDLVVIF